MSVGPALGRLLLCLALSAVLAAPAQARVSADVRWVEVNLGLQPDGKATVVYKVRYHVRSGELHGFYFQGAAGVPHWDRDRSVAEDDAGNRYSLSITSLRDNRYDIVLAGGGAIGAGREVTYILVYGVDLLRYGKVGLTESEFGELAYLNWAPVQWGEPLEHETVYVHYPVEARGEVTVERLGELNFRTERWVNERYLIDYRAQEFEGRRFLTVVLHREDLPASYHFRVQQYIDSSVFPLLGERLHEAGQPEFTLWRSPHDWRIVLLIALGVAGVALILLKGRRFAAARSRLADIDWEIDDWVPPKIQVAQYRQQGKVAEHYNKYAKGK